MMVENVLVEEILINSTANVGIAKSTLYQFPEPRWVSSHHEREGRSLGPITLLDGPKERGEPLLLFPVMVTEEASGITREVRTYGGGAANSDPYYQENLVLSDLAAGLYRVTLRFEDEDFQFWVEIYPGQVTYFTFDPEGGFAVATPPAPELDFLPYPLTPAP